MNHMFLERPLALQRFLPLTFLVCSLSAITAFTALAQTTTPADLESQRIELEARREAIQNGQATTASATGTSAREQASERQEAAAEVRSERRGALPDKVQQRVINLAANVSNHLEAAITRLTQIGDRLESRINKLRETGIDTSEANQHLADARGSLAVANNLLSDIDTTVFIFVSSENPRANWLQLKETYRSTRAAISEAFASLRASVAALKQAVTAGPAGPGVNQAVQAVSVPERSTCQIDADCVFFQPDCEDCELAVVNQDQVADLRTQKANYCAVNPPQQQCDIMVNGTPQCVSGVCQLVTDDETQ